MTFPLFFTTLFRYLSRRNPTALNFQEFELEFCFPSSVLPEVYRLPGENDIIHHGMLSVFIFRILPREENGKDEEGRSLRGRGILLLTLVSQLNPLASAINIPVMMSDEPPRRAEDEADQKRTSYFRMMLRVKGKERERASEKREG